MTDTLRERLLKLADAWNGHYGDKGLRLKAEATQALLRKAADALEVEATGFSDGVYVGTREDWIARCQYAEAKLAALEARAPEEHEPGCPAIADDESDQVLYDYGECVCRASRIQRINKWITDAEEDGLISTATFIRGRLAEWKLEGLAGAARATHPEPPACAKCRQPKVHPFHAPKGLFGGELETHPYEPPATRWLCQLGAGYCNHKQCEPPTHPEPPRCADCGKQHWPFYGCF